ncbi:MAG: hypothetical protein MHM6MM_006843 [Cercozoa sp. M6MM]
MLRRTEYSPLSDFRSSAAAVQKPVWQRLITLRKSQYVAIVIVLVTWLVIMRNLMTPTIESNVIVSEAGELLTVSIKHFDFPKDYVDYESPFALSRMPLRASRHGLSPLLAAVDWRLSDAASWTDDISLQDAESQLGLRDNPLAMSEELWQIARHRDTSVTRLKERWQRALESLETLRQTRPMANGIVAVRVFSQLDSSAYERVLHGEAIIDGCALSSRGNPRRLSLSSTLLVPRGHKYKSTFPGSARMDAVVVCVFRANDWRAAREVATDPTAALWVASRPSDDSGSYGVAAIPLVEIEASDGAIARTVPAMDVHVSTLPRQNTAFVIPKLFSTPFFAAQWVLHALDVVEVDVIIINVVQNVIPLSVVRRELCEQLGSECSRAMTHVVLLPWQSHSWHEEQHVYAEDLANWAALQRLSATPVHTAVLGIDADEYLYMESESLRNLLKDKKSDPLVSRELPRIAVVCARPDEECTPEKYRRCAGVFADSDLLTESLFIESDSKTTFKPQVDRKLRKCMHALGKTVWNPQLGSRPFLHLDILRDGMGNERWSSAYLAKHGNSAFAQQLLQRRTLLFHVRTGLPIESESDFDLNECFCDDWLDALGVADRSLGTANASLLGQHF